MLASRVPLVSQCSSRTWPSDTLTQASSMACERFGHLGSGRAAAHAAQRRRATLGVALKIVASTLRETGPEAHRTPRDSTRSRHRRRRPRQQPRRALVLATGLCVVILGGLVGVGI